MRRVDAARARRDRGELDDLVLRSADFLRVFEAGRKPGGALLERLRQGARHGVALGAVGGTVGEADRAQAQLAVRREGQDVDRRTHGGKAFEIAGHAAGRQPVLRGRPVDRERRQRRVRDRRAAMTAIADDLQRDALVDRTRRARIHDQRVVGMAVHIDEAGRDHEALRVDARRACRNLWRPDGGDPVAIDQDVDRGWRTTRAVMDLAAGDQDAAGHGVAPAAAARSAAVAASSTVTPSASRVIATP